MAPSPLNSSSKEEYYLQDLPSFNPMLRISDQQIQAEVIRLTDGFRLSIPVVSQIRSLFRQEIDFVLQLSNQKKNNGYRSSIPLINSFVTQFLTGEEVGNYFGLDIGTSNLRVIFVTLKPREKRPPPLIKNYEVPEHLRHGSIVKFFYHLAWCVQDFCDQHLSDLSLNGCHPIPLGFTFSFNYQQLALDRGRCIRCGLAANLNDAIDQDPVFLLQKSLNNFGLSIKVVALANDSTATLVYGKSVDPQTTASFILGSGSNIAYEESVTRDQRITDSQKVFGYKCERFLINTECMMFGDDGQMDFAKTRYDFELDASSAMPNFYTYEKMIGGAFLGELLRLTLVDLVRNRTLLRGRFKPQLMKRGSIETADMSSIESQSNILKSVNKLLVHLGYSSDEIEDDDLRIVLYVCQLISIRCALLCAIALSVFVDHIDRTVIRVACDGSLFKKHPKMQRFINSFMEKLCVNKEVKVFLADNGSSIGGALIAATCISSISSRR